MGARMPPIARQVIHSSRSRTGREGVAFLANLDHDLGAICGVLGPWPIRLE